MALYKDNKGRFIRVDKGMVPGTWSFFATKDLKKKGRNIRVLHDKKITGAVDRAWFDNPIAAAKGLDEYARDRGFKKVNISKMVWGI